jgi:hypothetical protein
MLFYNEKIFKRCFRNRGKYWYENIKEIPLYFKLMHHLIKHGYDEYATWETCDWFIYTMKDILSTYRAKHQGYPVVSWNDKEKQEAFEKEYDADFDKMISLLDDMDECNPKYKGYDTDLMFEELDSAKDKFFELFSKHFYSLWD